MSLALTKDFLFKIRMGIIPYIRYIRNWVQTLCISGWDGVVVKSEAGRGGTKPIGKGIQFGGKLILYIPYSRVCGSKTILREHTH